MVACCLVCVAYWLVFDVCVSFFVDCCLWITDCVFVCCLLSVRCLMFVVLLVCSYVSVGCCVCCCLLFGVRRVLFVVCCVLFVV